MEIGMSRTRLPQTQAPLLVEDAVAIGKTWPAVKAALKSNTDVAITLFRDRNSLS